jgi:Haem-binding domain
MAIRWVKRAVVGVAVLFGGAQLVPYGRDHQNPPVTSEPQWSHPSVRALAARACFDCHSNQTVWPWYSSVAPLSWMLQRDVDVGRSHLNFSEWDRAQQDAQGAASKLGEGQMPLVTYRVVHSKEALTPVERQVLVDGLRLTLGTASSAAGPQNRGALERWLAQADAELRFGITRMATVRW